MKEEENDVEKDGNYEEEEEDDDDQDVHFLDALKEIDRDWHSTKFRMFQGQRSARNLMHTGLAQGSHYGIPLLHLGIFHILKFLM